MEQNYSSQAELESAIKTETTASRTDASASVADLSQQALIGNITTPCESDSADDLLEKACNEFQNFSGVLFQNREMLYKALAYAYRYSRDASNEELKLKATERGVKVGEIADCRDKNRIVIELVCQRAAMEYPNLPDRKKIYRMLLNRLWDEDLSFEEVVDRLNSEGIEKIARRKTASDVAVNDAVDDTAPLEDTMVDDDADHFNNDKKEEVKNDILDCLNRLDLDEATQENLKNKIINIFDDETVTVNKFTPEQKKVMDALFDGRSKTGIKKTECYLHISQTETRYITRPDAVQKLTEKLSSFRESKNGKPYRSLFKNAED